MGFQGLKKGSAMDMVMVMVFCFIIVINIFVGYMIYEKWDDAAQASGSFDNDAYLNVTADTQTMLASFNYLFIFMIIGLAIMVIVSSFQINTHPMFFWVSMLLLIVVVVFSATMSNIYDDIVSDVIFTNATATYTVPDYFMNHLPAFLLGIGVLLMVALYAKQRQQGFG